MVHGKPCLVRSQEETKKKRRTSAVMEASSGGVAIILKSPRKPLKVELDDNLKDLWETGRWTKVRCLVANGKGAITCANIYGISGSASDLRKKKQNENILEAALVDMIQAGDEPYFIVGDFNVALEDSSAVSSAIEAGLAIDVGHTWATNAREDETGNIWKCPDPTFSHDTPMPGMKGPGVSRIDAILANPSGAAMIVDFSPRWDLVQVDHVPLEMKLSMDEFFVDELV